jgi:hypothetical protein
MKVSVTSIQKDTPNHFVAIVELDELKIPCRITELVDTELKGFNFDSPFFDAMFYLEGIGAQFNKDYGDFRNGSGRELPWDYGDHDESIVRRAEHLSKIQLSSIV